MISSLLGFIRKTSKDDALTISISADAFNSAKRITSTRGGEYVTATVRFSKLWDLINGRSDVISVNACLDEESEEVPSNKRGTVVIIVSKDQTITSVRGLPYGWSYEIKDG